VKGHGGPCNAVYRSLTAADSPPAGVNRLPHFTAATSRHSHPYTPSASSPRPPYSAAPPVTGNLRRRNPQTLFRFQLA
ncbi:hypothetical protein, partial [Salmonella enterica]|uniref:hypothetical protein n=1 Tax=Salmonella enterica TaxID=28901 RepID=UPI00398C448C